MALASRVENLAKLLANQDGWAYDEWPHVLGKGAKVYRQYAKEVLELLDTDS